MQPTVEVIIDPLGRTKVEANGFVGNTCEKATAGILQALAAPGGIDTDYKPEFFQEAAASAEVTQSGW